LTKAALRKARKRSLKRLVYNGLKRPPSTKLTLAGTLPTKASLAVLSPGKK
jgi:hypothetical protein